MQPIGAMAASGIGNSAAIKHMKSNNSQPVVVIAVAVAVAF